MKTKIKLITPLLAGAFIGLTAIQNADAQGLNFSSTPGSTIQFNGNSSSFQFNSSTSPVFGGIFSGTQWLIGSQTGGTGVAVGLLGWFNNGPFTYGPITSVISGSGLDQTAQVIGPAGGLQIKDGSGIDLTGNISWGELSTHNYLGGINSTLEVNITGLSYAGTNPDLIALASAKSAAMDLTFQFAPGMSLADLTTQSPSGPYLTSYSGSLTTTVPEPATIGCLALGLGILTFSRRFKNNQRI
jgi:hypothetical protein